jgi:UDP-N-acetylglucosamine 2-epimerase (non-hydrolysing)
MLAQVVDYFGMPIDIDLALMQQNQSLSGLTARCLETLDQTFVQHQPDCVVAQGDTVTVMAAALAAFFRRIPFVHVEAGLRTGNMYSPWPEELNRRVAGLVTAVHCAPTQRAAQNLLDEGVPESQVLVTGNTVVDALLWAVRRERLRNNDWRAQHAGLGDRPMVLITGHRRESFGSGFSQICEAIHMLAAKFPDHEFVYPVHLNPNVQEPVHRLLGDLANVHLLRPVAYPEFVWLMDRSTLILTDSGGVQEEAPSLRKPVLVMRDTTERPEAVESGAAELVGTSSATIVDRVSLLLTDHDEYARRQLNQNPYGDGRAAERIIDAIASRCWESPQPIRRAA